VNTEKLFLGKTESEIIYLYKHSWECDWYWGMGYVGNLNNHYHFEKFISNETDPKKIFPMGTNLTQSDWWVLRDLFIQAYALKHVAEIYQFGGNQVENSITRKIISEEKAAIANSDLKIILDTIWDYLYEVNMRGNDMRKDEFNLYLLTRTDEPQSMYDKYDSCIVCAKSAIDALTITPDDSYPFEEDDDDLWSSWVKNEKYIDVKEIGKAGSSMKRGVVLASFNAG